MQNSSIACELSASSPHCVLQSIALDSDTTSRSLGAHTPPQVLLAPAGIIACFRPLTDASLFLLLYGLAAVYFSGVMVRRKYSHA